jgi:sulfonate transport system substrate-binding protein
MKKKLLAVLIGATMIAGVFSGCGGTADSSSASDAGQTDDTAQTTNAEDSENTSDTSELKTLNIGVGGSDSSYSMELANLAYDNGYLEEELNAVGYTIEISAFQGAGPEVNEALASGSVNAAVYGDFPAFTSKSNGIETTVVATTNKKQQYGVLALGDISSASDLAGKKVIVPTGTVAQHFWESYVAETGLDANSVEIINTTDATSLLSTGEADAYVMTLPVLTYFTQLGLGSILEDSKQVEDGYSSYVFEVANSVLDETPDVGVAINKALIRAYEDAVKDPQALYDAVASEQMGADCYETEYAFDTSLEYLSPEITDESVTYYEGLNDWLLDHQLISEKVDLDTFLGRDYYQQAVDALGQE